MASAGKNRAFLNILSFQTAQYCFFFVGLVMALCDPQTPIENIYSNRQQLASKGLIDAPRFYRLAELRRQCVLR